MKTFGARRVCCLQRLHSSPIVCVEFSPDGKVRLARTVLLGTMQYSPDSVAAKPAVARSRQLLLDLAGERQRNCRIVANAQKLE
jgi:hypothetical protein